MRRYWITYFTWVVLISFLCGYITAECNIKMQYLLLTFVLSYGALGIAAAYGYRKISGLETGWAVAATLIFAIPGIGLIMLVNATIWSEDIAPNLFWAVTESMLTIGLSNALGMCIAPAFKKEKNH